MRPVRCFCCKREFTDGIRVISGSTKDIGNKREVCKKCDRLNEKRGKHGKKSKRNKV